jgi:hypothetical protein
VLLSIHLATNYAAVKAVSMRCLNRQRANIVFGSILQDGKVLTPLEVSQRERIFERDGVLRWVNGSIIGHCKIGVSLETLLSRMGQRHTRTGSLELQTIKLSEVMEIFVNEAYILWFVDNDDETMVVLKEGCTPIDQLKAWAHALLLAQKLRGHMTTHKPAEDDSISTNKRLALMRCTLEEANDNVMKETAGLEEKGWDLSIAALETRAGIRIFSSSNHCQ